MLKQVERVSRTESRTQSELVREALRRYFTGFPVVAASPAELKAIARGRAEFQRGEYVTLGQLLDGLGTPRRKVGAKGPRKAPAKRPGAR
jgi:predicted transcriptional regulator